MLWLLLLTSVTHVLVFRVVIRVIPEAITSFLHVPKTCWEMKPVGSGGEQPTVSPTAGQEVACHLSLASPDRMIVFLFIWFIGLSKSYYHVYRFSNVLNIIEIKGHSRWSFSSKKQNKQILSCWSCHVWKSDWREEEGRAFCGQRWRNIVLMHSNLMYHKVWFWLFWFTIQFVPILFRNDFQSNVSWFKRFLIQSIWFKLFKI